MPNSDPNSTPHREKRLIVIPSMRKMWSFLMVQKERLDGTKHHLLRSLSLDTIRKAQVSRVWKMVAYGDAILHTILGFAIVTFVAIVPEIISPNPSRLAAFCAYMFLHFSSGFLVFLGLFFGSGCLLKFVAVILTVLQFSVLGLTSNYKAECTAALKGLRSDSDESSQSLGMKDCGNLSFLASTIVLPNFIHSLIFCAVLIIYLYKRSGEERPRKGEENSDKYLECSGKFQMYQFANITVIVEEVV